MRDCAARIVGIRLRNCGRLFVRFIFVICWFGCDSARFDFLLHIICLTVRSFKIDISIYVFEIFVLFLRNKILSDQINMEARWIEGREGILISLNYVWSLDSIYHACVQKCGANRQIPSRTLIRLRRRFLKMNTG